MTFNPAKPRHTLNLAGTDYELEGSFALIEAVEYALKDDIVHIANRVMDLSVSQTAALLSAALNICGHRVSTAEIGRTITEKIGASGNDYAGLKLSLYAFLRICVAPPAEREGVAKDMGELIGKWKSTSPGESTSASA